MDEDSSSGGDDVTFTAPTTAAAAADATAVVATAVDADEAAVTTVDSAAEPVAEAAAVADATVAVPAPQEAAPPPAPTAAVDPLAGDSKTDDTAGAVAAPPVPAKPTPAVSSGSGAAMGTGASKCPAICNPGMDTLVRWVTWKETMPGAIIVTTAVSLYAMSLADISPISAFSFAAMLGVLAGALVQVHNKFMDPEIPVLRVPVRDESLDKVGAHVGAGLKMVVAGINSALSWKSSCKSLNLLAYLWLVFRFPGLLTSPAVHCTVVLLAFFAPMVFDMLRPQLTGVYNGSVKPVVNQVVAKLHDLHAKHGDMDQKRQALVAAGILVLLLIVWQLFGSFFSLWCLLSGTATTLSLGAVVGQHVACCVGGCSAAASAKKKTN